MQTCICSCAPARPAFPFALSMYETILEHAVNWSFTDTNRLIEDTVDVHTYCPNCVHDSDLSCMAHYPTHSKSPHCAAVSQCMDESKAATVQQKNAECSEWQEDYMECLHHGKAVSLGKSGLTVCHWHPPEVKV